MAAGSIVIDLALLTGKFETDSGRAAKIAEKRAREIERSFVSTGRAVSTAFATVASALALPVGVGAFTAFIKQTAEGIDRLNDFSDAFGTTVESASALEDVALRTGTSIDTVGTSLQKLNGLLAEASPKSRQAELLKQIGLNAEELKRIDPAEALRRVAVALEGYADDGNKARIVQELFGRSVKEVAPFLKDLAEKTELVGTVTREQAQEAEKFRKQLFELEKSATDAGRAIAGPLIASLNEGIEKFRKAREEGKSLFDIFRSNSVGLANQFFGSNRTDEDRLRTINQLLDQGFQTQEVTLELERERAELQERIAAAVTYAPVQPAATATKPSVGTVQTTDKPGGKAPVNDAEELLRKLQDQYITTLELTEAEKALIAIRADGFRGLTPSLEAAIVAQAQIIDLDKEEAESKKAALEATKAIGAARTRALESATAEADALRKGNDALRQEIEEIGASIETKAVLEQARIRSQRVIKEEQLAMLENAEAAAEETDALRQQIELLRQREELIGAKKDKTIEQQADEVASLGDKTIRSIADSLVDGTLAGRKFSDVLKDITADLVKMAAKKIIIDLIVSAFNGGSTGGSSFGGFFADGGPVSPGKTYVVGENGPEIFKPSSAGTIIPNDELRDFSPVVGERPAPTGASVQFVNKVEIVNNAPAEVRTEDRPGGGLRVIIDTVKREMARDVRSGGVLATSIAGTFGANPAAGITRR